MELTKVFFGEEEFYFRNGTSDALLVSKNLISDSDRDYLFPNINPSVIFDIGANIGVISFLMSHIYPEARIFSFEPQKDNFEILRLNTQKLPNVSIFNYGLGASSRKDMLYFSDTPDNFGGYSIFKDYADTTSAPNEIEIKSINSVLDDLQISEIDIIKIDCEGAEKEILESLSCLNRSKYITGELHGVGEYRILEMLSDNFNLSFSKKLLERNFNFSALRKDLCPK